jgi:outer membrane protein assembly factor BamD (BamD/ComL family)
MKLTSAALFSVPGIALGIVLAALPAFGQRSGGTSAASSAPSGGAGSISSPTRSSVPANNNNYPSSNYPSSPSLDRPIFLSGKVAFDDGSPPDSNIRIERVCAGNARLEAHADSKGRFSFQVGQNSSIDTDASDSSEPGFGRNTGYGAGAGSMGSGANSRLGGSGAGSVTGLWNCELRASFPGFRSDLVELGARRSLDNPDVGTIILHRLTNVQGTTLSATTLAAPKHAQKDYDKGMQLAAKGKFDEAETRFEEATTTYPKYAIAWFALGEIQQREGKAEKARQSYQAAITADPKYVSPYDQMALLSAQEGKWEDAASFSGQVISLNPVEFPSSFWYNAVANYNLKKTENAEKSVRALLKSGSAQKYPGAENLMAQILLDKGELSEAAVHMRAYLTLQPNAKNAAAIKQMLDRIDQQNAEAKK